MSISRTWNFLKRHRRKFLVVGVLAGGAYWFNRYARRKLREWEEQQAAECLDLLKKEQHFDSTQKLCDQTVRNFAGTLKSRLTTLLNCECLTSRLQARPPDRLLIWNQLKSVAFSRAVAAIYGASILVTLLKVQLNVLGGYMYNNTIQPGDSVLSQKSRKSPPLPPESIVSQNVQHSYLQLVQHFLNVGCQEMVDAISLSVTKVMDEIPLKRSLRLKDVEDLLRNIRVRFESGVASGSPRVSTRLMSQGESQCSNSGTDDDDMIFVSSSPPSLLGFALPKEQPPELQADLVNRHEIMLEQLIAETRDLFETEDCQSVFTSTVDLGFSSFLDNLAGFYALHARPTDLEEISESVSALSDDMSDGRLTPESHQPGREVFCNLNDVSLPLAKLLPPVTNSIHVLCGCESNQLLNQLLALNCQKMLAANIYEAFIQMLKSKQAH